MTDAKQEKFILYLDGSPAASFDSLGDAEDAVLRIFNKIKEKGYKAEIRREFCDQETVKKIQESLISYVVDLINEVATVPSVGTVAGSTNPTANVANTSPASSPTISSAPKTQQEIDAMAQILKNAGLNQAQLNQIIAKAR